MWKLGAFFVIVKLRVLFGRPSFQALKATQVSTQFLFGSVTKTPGCSARPRCTRGPWPWWLPGCGGGQQTLTAASDHVSDILCHLSSHNAQSKEKTSDTFVYGWIVSWQDRRTKLPLDSLDLFNVHDHGKNNSMTIFCNLVFQLSQLVLQRLEIKCFSFR